MAAVLLAACTPDAPEVPELPLLYEGNVWGGNLAVANGRVYFTTFYHGPEMDQAVLSVPATGGVPSLVWHGAPGAIFGRGMAVNGNAVFWTQQDGELPSIFVAPASGGDRVTLGKFTTAMAPNTGVAVDDDWILAGSGREIVRISRNGGAALSAYSGRVQWIDRASPNGPLYFVGDGVLVNMNPFNATISPAAVIAGASTVEAAGDEIYVGAGDAVWSVPRAGGLATKVFSGLVEVEGLAASDTELFIATHQGDRHQVLRVPRTGGTPTMLYETRAVAPSMVFAEGALFLAFCCEDPGSTEGGRVVRLDL